MGKRHICERCGGEDVVRDAHAAWDAELQMWEIASLYDAAFCRNCDREVELREVEAQE